MTRIRLRCLEQSLKEFHDRCESSINFTFRGYVDADEDVAVTSEGHPQADSEIIARVTQTQLDVLEHDDENEEDDADRKMSPPRTDQVRQAIKILQSCCLYQDNGRAEDARISGRDRETMKFHCSNRSSNHLPLTF